MISIIHAARAWCFGSVPDNYSTISTWPLGNIVAVCARRLLVMLPVKVNAPPTQGQGPGAGAGVTAPVWELWVVGLLIEAGDSALLLPHDVRIVAKRTTTATKTCDGERNLHSPCTVHLRCIRSCRFLSTQPFLWSGIMDITTSTSK
jgi:hypothetical protein